MKKILAFISVAVLAASTHAAAVGWSIGGLGGTYAGDAYSVFIIGINGVTSAEQITALVEAGSDISSYAFGSGTIASTAATQVAATSSGKSITYSGSGTDTYTAFAIVFDASTQAAAGNYGLTPTKTISLTNDSTSKTIGFGNVSSTLVVSPVPEPTSVALLALGLAALGLKRKVA